MLLPCSAALELSAFLLFFGSVGAQKRKHMDAAKAEGKRYPIEIWIKLVFSAMIGFFLTLLFNFGFCVDAALRGDTPALSHVLDQRFLVLAMWGFIAVAIWGFSARWLPVFVGLRKPHGPTLLAALACVAVAVIATMLGWTRLAGVLVLLAALNAVFGLHVFARAEGKPKTQGIHASFPIFIRIAYGWMLIAAVSSIWALDPINRAASLTLRVMRSQSGSWRRWSSRSANERFRHFAGCVSCSQND